jgi:hypothetical protein
MSSELSPAERSLRARAAAYRLHSLYDSRELTAKARAAFSDRFARQVDPEGILPEAERRRRAECARKAYFAELAAKSAAARRVRKRASRSRWPLKGWKGRSSAFPCGASPVS